MNLGLGQLGVEALLGLGVLQRLLKQGNGFLLLLPLPLHPLSHPSPFALALEPQTPHPPQCPLVLLEAWLRSLLKLRDLIRDRGLVRKPWEYSKT